MRGVVIAIWLLSTTAAADDLLPSVRVTAKATSETAKQPANLAIDSNIHGPTWCANKGDGVGESVTLTFDQPIAISSLDVVVGYDDNKVPAPDKVEIKTDTETQTVATRASNFNKVPLKGTPTKAVTLKIVSMPPGKKARPCVGTRIVSTSKSGRYYQFIYGLDKDAVAALPAFVKKLDAAFKKCDATALATGVKFPIEHEHEVMMPDGYPDGPDIKKATYKTAADLAKACASPATPLAFGFAGWDPDAVLDDEIKTAVTYKPGELRLGGGMHEWVLGYENKAWQLRSIKTGEDGMVGEAIRGLAESQVSAWAEHSDVALRNVFADDAKITVLGAKQAIVDARDAGASLASVILGKHTIKDVAIGLARDHRAAWLTFTLKAGSDEYHVTEVISLNDAQWQVQAGMWARAQPNAAVNKAAAAGTTPKIAPLAKADADEAIREAFVAMQGGPLDKTAAARKDLVVFGSGPGERTVGGAKLATPWKAWAGHIPLAGGLVAQRAPSGTTGWAIADVLKGKVPFRLFVVFDQQLDGTWSVVAVNIATPQPT